MIWPNRTDERVLWRAVHHDAEGRVMYARQRTHESVLLAQSTGQAVVCIYPMFYSKNGSILEL